MSLLKHLQECADEAGEELFDTLTNERSEEYRGHTLEIYYNENRCGWACFVKGIGESTGIGGRDDDAIAYAKQRIDAKLGSNQ